MLNWGYDEFLRPNKNKWFGVGKIKNKKNFLISNEAKKPIEKSKKLK